MTIGIDNALSGAVARVEGSNLLWVKPMPVFKTGKGRELDAQKLREWLVLYGGMDSVVVERPSKHSPGVLALCSTWQCYGGIMAVLALTECRVVVVDAAEWQKEFWSRPKMAKGKKFDTKAASIATARKLWPGQDWRLTDRCSKDNDGLTDAALIAEYGRRKQF